MWVSLHIQDRKNEHNVQNFHALTDYLKNLQLRPNKSQNKILACFNVQNRHIQLE